MNLSARLRWCVLAVSTVTLLSAAGHLHAQATPAWLTRVNLYRATAGLPGVTENLTYSDGDWKHARYIVKTDTLSHSEVSTSPWYTPEGATAAANGDLSAFGSSTTTANTAIDLWMQGPFHALGILDPKLRTSGFGLYNEADGGYQSGAALDVLRGRGAIPAGVTFPIAWPGNASSVPLTSYGGTESPSPLTSCPGYTAPTGLPILLQLGAGTVTPSVTASSFSSNGVSLLHCVFDQTTYVNPVSSDQSLARSIVSSRSAIVLIPRAPLTSGATYDVSITTNGNVVHWSFSVNALAGCSYGVSPTSASSPASGGSGSVAVTTTAGCAWTATSNASWISVPPGAGGTGGGTVGYTVALNTSASPRTGTMTVAGQTVTVTQAAAAPSCTYTVSPTGTSVPAGGGAGTATVTTTSGCGWTAATIHTWITVTSGSSGTGPGGVGYAVAANPTTSARVGSLTVAGLTFTVSQAGLPLTAGIFNDDFARADSTVLGNGWVEAQGDLQIRNNELTNVSTNGYEIGLVPLTGADMSAGADFAFTQHQGTPHFGVVLRYQDPKNYYLLYRQAGGSSLLRISKIVNGVETVLKVVTLANPAKDVFFRIDGDVTGTTLTLKLNGLVKATATDATFASGQVGLLMGSTLSHIHRADNFTATAQ